MSRQVAAELAQMRERWAARPKALPPRPAWFPVVPGYAEATRFRGQVRAPLWEGGIVDWGWMLMADEPAWSPGPLAVPGRVLYTDDAVLRRDPVQLQEVAARVWRYREAAYPPGHARRLREWARDPGPADAIGLVPRDFTTGRVVWAAGLLVYRDHLVGGFLRDPLVPIVRPPAGQAWCVTLLPLPFWADGLQARWSASR